MKNLSLFLGAAFLLLNLFSCRTIDPDTGIVTEIAFDRTFVRSNAMDAGETWTDTKTFPLAEELRENYGIDLDRNELLTFRINGVTARINTEQCRKLSDLTVSVAMPGIDAVTQSASGALLDALCERAEVLAVPSDDFPNTQLTEKDFADEISNGGALRLDYALTAEEDLSTAPGLDFSVLVTMSYRPKN